MFRHQGKTRTLKHNLQIASLLSFIAGIVNVAGFFAVQRLTTNVTGHFAYLMDEVLKLNFVQGFVYLLYILFFFSGSFVSSLIIELVSRKNERYIYAAPVLIEFIILISMGIWGDHFILLYPDIVAFSLLFAMGLQNSLVTSISNSDVRTTHLTGLFTDLGIELSQVFFYKSSEQQTKLKASIRLRLTIITFFFIGGIFGGTIYTKIGLAVLIIAAIILLLGLIYDNIKFGLILLRRKINGL